jgi:hypothetical protein
METIHQSTRMSANVVFKKKWYGHHDSQNKILICQNRLYQSDGVL